MDDIDERLAAFSRLFAEQAGTSAEAIESASNTGDVHRLQQLWRGAKLLAISSKRWKQGSRHKACQLQSTG